MFFSLYGKRRLATPSPAQLLLLKQRHQLLQMTLLAKNNIPEPIQYTNEIVCNESNKEKEVIIYELEVETESIEIPEPKMEEPIIQELSYPVVEEVRETREVGETGETRETREEEKKEKKGKKIRKNRKI
jgi:hypothetical protein